MHLSQPSTLQRYNKVTKYHICCVYCINTRGKATFRQERGFLIVKVGHSISLTRMTTPLINKRKLTEPIHNNKLYSLPLLLDHSLYSFVTEMQLWDVVSVQYVKLHLSACRPLTSSPHSLPPFISVLAPPVRPHLTLLLLPIAFHLSPPPSSLSLIPWTFGREGSWCCRPVLYIRCQASDRDSGLWVNTLTASTEDILSVKWSLHYSRLKKRRQEKRQRGRGARSLIVSQ